MSDPSLLFEMEVQKIRAASKAIASGLNLVGRDTIFDLTDYDLRRSETELRRSADLVATLITRIEHEKE